jgi:hypothetical protein
MSGGFAASPPEESPAAASEGEMVVVAVNVVVAARRTTVGKRERWYEQYLGKEANCRGVRGRCPAAERVAVEARILL